MIEQWKDAPGYEGRYQVSDAGRVRSLPHKVRSVDKVGVERQRTSPGKVLRPGSSRGYLIVNLSGFGTISVHILVARAFCKGESPTTEVNHKDGNKHNCSAANLEWVSKTRNMEHAVDIGLNTQAVPVIHPDTGKIYPSMSRAAKACRVRITKISSTWSRA